MGEVAWGWSKLREVEEILVWDIDRGFVDGGRDVEDEGVGGVGTKVLESTLLVEDDEVGILDLREGCVVTDYSVTECVDLGGRRGRAVEVIRYNGSLVDKKFIQIFVRADFELTYLLTHTTLAELLKPQSSPAVANGDIVPGGGPWALVRCMEIAASSRMHV